MAEIKIEKKKPIWPWILLAVAIIALLIYLFSSSDGGEERDEVTEVTTEDSSNISQAGPNDPTVAAYVNFIQDDPDSMGIHHEFTNEALLKLTNATNTIADQIGYDIKKDMEEVKSNADKITNDPFETTHANSIRKAAETLAVVLQNIQQKAFPNLASDADEVKNAASNIKPDVLTLDQRDAVKNYFRESSELLEKMNTYSPEN